MHKYHCNSFEIRYSGISETSILENWFIHTKQLYIFKVYQTQTSEESMLQTWPMHKYQYHVLTICLNSISVASIFTICFMINIMFAKNTKATHISERSFFVIWPCISWVTFWKYAKNEFLKSRLSKYEAWINTNISFRNVFNLNFWKGDCQHMIRAWIQMEFLWRFVKDKLMKSAYVRNLNFWNIVCSNMTMHIVKWHFQNMLTINFCLFSKYDACMNTDMSF